MGDPGRCWALGAGRWTAGGWRGTHEKNSDERRGGAPPCNTTCVNLLSRASAISIWSIRRRIHLHFAFYAQIGSGTVWTPFCRTGMRGGTRWISLCGYPQGGDEAGFRGTCARCTTGAAGQLESKERGDRISLLKVICAYNKYLACKTFPLISTRSDRSDELQGSSQLLSLSRSLYSP